MVPDIVETFDSHGMPVNMTAMRPRLFVLIDTASRCILGYSVTQSEEYNQFDVLKAFRHAILPKSRMKFTLPGLAYPENGGFPDTAMPEIQYPMIGAVMLDNAMSHLAKNTVEKLVMEYEGRTLTLGINPDNIRYIDAYDENGIFIDTLHATGPWGSIDHSYQVRGSVPQQTKLNHQSTAVINKTLAASEFGDWLDKMGSVLSRAINAYGESCVPYTDAEIRDMLTGNPLDFIVYLSIMEKLLDYPAEGVRETAIALDSGRDAGTDLSGLMRRMHLLYPARDYQDMTDYRICFRNSSNIYNAFITGMEASGWLRNASGSKRAVKPENYSLNILILAGIVRLYMDYMLSAGQEQMEHGVPIIITDEYEDKVSIRLYTYQS